MNEFILSTIPIMTWVLSILGAYFAVLCVIELRRLKKLDDEEKYMPRKYVYTDEKTGDRLFETTEPNYASQDVADKKMFAATKRDPRLDPFVECKIYVVGEVPSKTIGRFDKNKKMS